MRVDRMAFLCWLAAVLVGAAIVPAQAAVINLGGITARWIALDIDSNLGGSFVGLSELLVFQDLPEPSSHMLAAIGLAAPFLVRRWRHRPPRRSSRG